MAFDIIFYNNAAEINRVDKTSYLSNATTLNGTLREQCSITNPEIIIEYASTPTWNYCYIAEFGRYYFITDGVTAVRENLWRIPLKRDVLMSYKNEIKATTAIIARQEYQFNADLNDPLLPCESEQNVEVIDIPSTAFDVSSSIGVKYLLTVVGAA